jgi:hypothetical protein
MADCKITLSKTQVLELRRALLKHSNLADRFELCQSTESGIGLSLQLLVHCADGVTYVEDLTDYSCW